MFLPPPTPLSTATLIAGPSAAEVIYNEPSLSMGGDEKCNINGAEADCTAVIVVDGTTSTEAFTETVAPFEVQGGGSLSGSNPAPATSTPTASIPTQTSAGSSTPSAGASAATTQSTGAPAPSTTANGAISFHAAPALACLSAVTFAILIVA